MFDYDNHHNDITAVITASNLDFDTDIRFNNDTFSIDNGDILAIFSTMHQHEDLRHITLLKHDDSLYTSFQNAYVNRIHVDFLENVIKASVVIKTPTIEEETRLVEEMTRILAPESVSTTPEKVGTQNDLPAPNIPGIEADTQQGPAPKVTFADSPEADKAFFDLIANPSDYRDIPEETNGEAQHDLPAPDITGLEARAQVVNHETEPETGIPAEASSDLVALNEKEAKTQDGSEVAYPDYANDDEYLAALYESLLSW